MAASQCPAHDPPDWTTDSPSSPASPASPGVPIVPPTSDQVPFEKNASFWFSFVALLTAVFLSAIDLTAVSTALPLITHDLHGGLEFSWVGSAYSLASTAVLPLSGRFADIFGRKPVMLGSIVMFAAGSAVAGAAQSMGMLIGARAIQGIGGGGILNLTDIITSDLVPLSERGLYEGIIAVVWAVASGIGPPIGGAFAQRASWRWLFFLNLPLTGIAFAIILVFLRVRTPGGSIKTKLARVDWLGNVIVIAGTTLIIVALTSGGVRYRWQAREILAPLIVGLFFLVCFFVYEYYLPPECDPTIPWDIVRSATSVSGLLATLIHGIISIAVIYYLPVFFQACFGASPLNSSVNDLPSALLIAPCAVIAAVTIQVTTKYRPTNAVGWVLCVVGFGVMTLLRADNTTGQWAGFQMIAASGIGVLYTSTLFPVLAPLPVERNAAALAFYTFLRTLGQTVGISLSGSILQNELKRRLPVAFSDQFPEGSDFAYAAVPEIAALSEPLRTEVRVAFAASMAIVWRTMIVVSALGLLTLVLLREVKMQDFKDDRYALDVRQRKGDPEQAGAAKEAGAVPARTSAETGTGTGTGTGTIDMGQAS